MSKIKITEKALFIFPFKTSTQVNSTTDLRAFSNCEEGLFSKPCLHNGCNLSKESFSHIELKI